MAKSRGLKHIRNVNAFISKVMVFDKMVWLAGTANANDRWGCGKLNAAERMNR
jgi:hypothetical protein